MKKKPALKSARKQKEINHIDLEDSFANNWLLNFNIRKPYYMNSVHREFYNTLRNKETNMVFVDGPAGSAKTYFAIYSALEQLKDGVFDKVIYIRSIAESAQKSLGYLPGELNEKFSPYAMPLIEKVVEITNETTASMLEHRGLIEGLPVNFVRGLTFKKSFVIIDEAQNLHKSELITILTRFGYDSRYVICGDSNQQDIPKSGFKEIYYKFENEESKDNNIFTFKFGENEIVRSKILKYICKVVGV